jgi:predicted AlkP superfamily phosphohydrolase/phosphomutase
MPRVLLIAWDGADWRILDPLLESGALPNLAGLIERGGRAVLDSVVPIHSWSAWPSFMTGVDPADHGVFDILEAREGTRRRFPVSFRSIRERTFLADLTAAGVETVMINVPLTFPPPRIKGKLIAGGVLPRGRSFTYPEELPEELRHAGAPFPINGMSWTTYRNRPEPFLEEVVDVTTARQRSLEHLLDTTDWRVACAVFVATDRVQHCLAKYVSNDHPDYESLSKEPVAEKIRDVYRLLDDGLGRVLQRTTLDDLVLFVSDHGFHSCTHAVHMDRLLAGLGLLDFSASNAVFGPMQWGPMRSLARKVYDRLGLHGKVPLPHSVNWSKTTAYTSVRTTGEGVSINLAGREPEGIVDPADHERVRDQVAEQLLAFVDPATGRHPIAGVRRREQVFKGRFAAVESADWLSGDHRLDGVLAAAGASVDPSAFAGRRFNLVDLAPTILAAVKASSSVPHSGTVLGPLVGRPAMATVIPGMAADPEESDTGFDMGEEEAEEVEEHLRGLGYLE